MDVILHRVPVNSEDYSLPKKEKVLLLFQDKYFAILTSQDTLVLKLVKLTKEFYVYQEVGSKQRYSVKKNMGSNGFSVHITPIRPFNRRLYSLNMMSI
jgi:hypothetical protein